MRRFSAPTPRRPGPPSYRLLGELADEARVAASAGARAAAKKGRCRNVGERNDGRGRSRSVTRRPSGVRGSAPAGCCDGPRGIRTCGDGRPAAAAQPDDADRAGASPAATQRQPALRDRPPLTEEMVAARHNIFDEFALERGKVWEAAAGFRTPPWKIHIGGQVAKALTLDVDELISRAGGVEERLYRHRCVERWAMAVPWTGIPMRRLVEIAAPLAAARFVRVLTASKPDEMPGWYASKRVFPYYEALSIDEATNELAFLATGIYGHPLPAAARRADPAGGAVEVRIQEREVTGRLPVHRRAADHVLEPALAGPLRLLGQRRSEVDQALAASRRDDAWNRGTTRDATVERIRRDGGGPVSLTRTRGSASVSETRRSARTDGSSSP